MRRETQLDLIRRALDHIRRGTTDTGDPRLAPVERYTSAAQADRERRVLFRRYPSAVGFASQVAEPGAFLTRDVAGVPVLVNRDRDGELRAFVNACRHRGTRLVAEPAGNRAAFVCRYHGWSYGDDGALRNVPHAAGFPHVDRARCGLLRLPVRARCGLLWVVPDPRSDLDIDAYLGPLADELDGLGMASHVLYAPRVERRRANWKLALDASLENYHVKVAHRASIAPMFVDNVVVVDAFGPHTRAFLPKRTIHELSGRDFADRELAGQELTGRDEQGAPDLADSDVRGYGNIIYFLFPATLVLVQPDHAAVMMISPDGPDGFVVHGGALIPEHPDGDRARRHWDRNVDMFWDAIAEDFEMMEEMQVGIASGALPGLAFGSFEHAAGWFHDAIAAALASGADGSDELDEPP